jgi:hypothetical protein
MQDEIRFEGWYTDYDTWHKLNQSLLKMYGENAKDLSPLAMNKASYADGPVILYDGKSVTMVTRKVDNLEEALQYIESLTVLYAFVEVSDINDSKLYIVRGATV